MRLLIILGSFEGDCEVVAERIDNDHHGLFEFLRMPTPFLGSCLVGPMERYRRNGALGFVLKDKSGKEEAVREEKDPEALYDTDTCIRPFALVSSGIMFPVGLTV